MQLDFLAVRVLRLLVTSVLCGLILFHTERCRRATLCFTDRPSLDVALGFGFSEDFSLEDFHFNLFQEPRIRGESSFEAAVHQEL